MTFRVSFPSRKWGTDMLDFDQSDAAQAIRSLVASGIAEKEIHELVAVAINEQRDMRVEDDAGGDLPIYDELPEGLIDLPTAARRYRRATGTVRQWASDGQLEVVGRLRAPAPGGGYLVFRDADVSMINDITPRRNR